MPVYTIEFKKSARKELDKLPSLVQRKVFEAVQFLSQNPYSDLLQVKKLKGAESLYRIRIGDYRLVYQVENQRLIVIVIKIGHRSDVYR